MRAMRANSAPAMVLVAVLTAAACGGAASAPAAPAASAAAKPAASAPAAPAASAPAAAAAAPRFDLAALEKAAIAEGALTLYTVQSAEITNRLKKSFGAKYPGITLSILSQVGPTLKAKWTAEVKAGQVLADVVVMNEYSIFDTEKAALASLTDLPGWQAYPEQHRTPIRALVSIGPRHTLINTKLVKPGEITTYSDLTNKKWKGLLVMSDPKTSPTYLNLWRLVSDDVLRGIGANTPRWENGGPASNMVAAGEMAVGLTIGSSFINPLVAKGAPIAVITLAPESGSTIWAAMFAKAKHPNAARLFANYILTKEGQQDINGDGIGSSPLPGVPGTEALSPAYVATNEAISQAEIDRIVKLLGSP